MSTPHTPPTTSPLALAAAGLAALAVAMGIGRFAFTPVLPLMLHDAGLTLAAGAWLAAANYAGYLLGALAALLWPQPPGRVIRAGLLSIALLTLAMAAPLGLPCWLLLRLLAGLASAWLLIAVSAFCLEGLARHERPALGSLVFCGVGCGIAGAGLLCLLVGWWGASSATAWSALGLLALLLTALVWSSFPAAAGGVGGGARAAVAPLRWNGAALRLVACYGAYGFGYIIPATFLPVMTRALLPPGAGLDLAWPLFGLAAAVSTLLVAPLGRRYSRRRIWAVSQLVMAVGIALPALWPGLPSLMAAALCVGGTFMVITLVALQEARRLAGAAATTLIAAMTAAFALGQMLGPLTVRLAGAGSASLGPALLLAAGLLLLSTLLLRTPAPPIFNQEEFHGSR